MAVATRSSSTRPPRRPRRTSLYLDLLPAELRDIIARQVCSGRRTSSALSLAQTTTPQLHAVISALSYAFSLHRCASDPAALLAWIPLFDHAGVRKLSITSSFHRLPTPLRTGALRLLAAPTLRTARVPDHPRVLRALARGAALHRLSVSLCETAPSWPMDATRLFMRTLAVHPLRVLEVHCAVPWEAFCPLRRIERLVGSGQGLAESCPALEEFHAPACVHGDEAYWQILRSLASVRTVTVRRRPPPEDEDVMRFLRSVESVHVQGVERATELARSVGAGVKSVIKATVASAGEVRMLTACPALTRLQLGLGEDGLEAAVLELVGELPALTALGLTWEQSIMNWRIIRFENQVNIRETRFIHKPCYIEAANGILARLVKQAPALARIDLCCVRVRVEEVVSMLRSLGRQLVTVGLPFHDQHEGMTERFDAFTKTILECNPELTAVFAGPGERLPEDIFIEEIKEEECDEEQVRWLRRGKQVVREVRRRVRNEMPRLKGGFESWIKAVQWIPGTEAGSIWSPF